MQKFPFLLSIVAVLGGVFIAILFGADETIFKDRIAAGLEKNVKIQAIEDVELKKATIKAEAEKNWRYYQRYHFHANGIASLTLAILILLAFIEVGRRDHLITSYLVSVGGFLYPFVWFFAGVYGPSMGRSEAKEAFEILGYMGGLFLVGVIYFLYLAVSKPWKAPFAR